MSMDATSSIPGSGATHSVLALAGRCNPEWLRRLRAALPDEWPLRVRGEDGDGRLLEPGESADVVVIGEDYARPLWVARQIDRHEPRPHLVFVAGGEAARRMRQTLAATSLRAGVTVLDADARAQDWGEALVRAARQARQSRRTRGALDHVNALLAGQGESAVRRLPMPEAYLASLLDHLPKAVFSTDPEGRIVSWNPAARGLFGLAGGEAEGRPVADLFPAPDRPQVLRLWRAAYAERARVQQGFGVLRPDGTRVETSLLFAPIRHDGEVSGVLAVAEDVTERLNAQAERRLALRREQRARRKLQKTLSALSERERIARLLSEASGLLSSSLDYESTLARVAELAIPEFADWCAVDMVDEDGQLQRLAVARSERAAGMGDALFPLGRQARPRGYGAAPVVRSGEPQLVRRITEAMLREYAVDETELTALRSCGLQSFMCLPLNARGQTLGAVTLVSARPGHRYGRQELAVAREIAARASMAVDNARLYRRGQHELAEREQAQRQAAVRARQQEAVAHLGHTALARGELDALLDAAVRQIGETLEVGLSDIQELLPDRSRLRLRAGYGWPREMLGRITPATTETFGGRALARNRPVVMEDLHRLPDSPALGVLREHGAVAGVSVVIPGDDGPYGVLGAFSRESRRFTREDVNFLEAVASVIAAAVRRLQLEATLRRQAEELALADRRKNEFLAMLAHELRNPLGAAHNAVELLALRGDDPKTLRMSVGVLGRQTRQLSRMVDDLLDVARITSGRIRLRRSRVLLSELIEQGVQTGEPLVEERAQQLTVELPPEPIELDADPVRLAQVVSNLIGNAAKYTQPGGAITIRAWREAAEAVLSVCDNGSGIAPDLLPHVFELFVQSDDSLDRAEGGLGLGLTLVRQLTEMHGGSVEARSEGPGCGSEFIVRLPLPEDAAQARDAAAADARIPPRRVLVVEDNPDVGGMLIALLRSLGHEAQLAADGGSALKQARRLRPEVVFLDVGLPDMDGYEVARRLRAEHRGRRMVVATLSGYGPPGEPVEAVDVHLLKPARVEELNTVLARA